ncbi:hypothetical protein Desde_0515 [Desulfitobacterium dehalogenans ATCC 51507]|uniref:Membrane-spanning protein n=1 Tax=Desulfitobacterium dehalogenans (strain ATCC 51507 / DSM 9161 / JW/IU-DC1) TaxID=756499 RepID=I4A4U1_DESDJ|nr:hypothetical protein [Desulfitobacterium dehalogenans]AFL98975.1 hypothetical protein Desde_0515 [Desulfitobacterium dehalogenans ATCC 51507]
MLKKLFNQKTLFGFIFFTMVLSTLFVTVKIFQAPTVADQGELSARVKGDYTLMLLQCIFGTLALLLPSFIAKRFKIVIPSGMIVAYAVFLYCAIYLGEVRSFYYKVPHWDTILHTFSGAMLGALGLTLISFLNNTDRIPVYLSPLFVAIFTFCFAVALGVVWEIYEFTIDSLFLTNMQKYALENGTPLIGQAALADTMKDLIVDCIGALAFSVFGYISLKSKKGWLERLQ